MEINKVLCMEGGQGEFGFAQASRIRGEGDGTQLSSVRKLMVEKAIQDLMSKKIVRPSEVLNVADLGCGVGPKPLAVVSLIKEAVKNIFENDGDQMPEIQIHFSDLPSNDFNLLFMDLAKMPEVPATKYHDGVNKPSCFFLGAPGSFYGRLFPRNSLHFVHSNYAIHWLSQVPKGLYDGEGKSINKGGTHVSEKSPSTVLEAYKAQFRDDFMSFINCRSQEVVPGGYMFLVALSRPSTEFQLTWLTTLLCEAIDNLVSSGLIGEEKRDAFDFPCYYPSINEIQDVVEKDGSFSIEQVENVIEYVADQITDIQDKAGAMALYTRSIFNSILAHHFGECVCSQLYEEFTELLIKRLEKYPSTGNLLRVILLTRKCDE